jgi:hypothetical protein
MVDSTLAVPLARERALAILRRLLHRVCYFCFCTGGVRLLVGRQNLSLADSRESDGCQGGRSELRRSEIFIAAASN